jgi:hypothetical protein
MHSFLGVAIRLSVMGGKALHIAKRKKVNLSLIKIK